MNHKLTTCLIAIALIFLMSFGSVCCVATGLELDVEFGALALGCLLLSTVAAVLYTIPKCGRYAVGLGALTLLLLTYNDEFQAQVLSLCKQAMTFYSSGYAFALPEALEDVGPASHMLPLLTVAGLIDLVAAWTILHRYPAALAVFLSVFPLVSCFVVIDTVPHIWALSLWLMGLGLLIMTQSVRIRNPLSANRLTAILTLPLLIGLTLLFILIPRENFTPPITLSSFEDSVAWLVEGIPFLGQTSDGRLVLNFGNDLPDNVNLGGLGDRNANDIPLLEVTSSQSGTIYLRIRDYDRYTGTGWETSNREEIFEAPSSLFTDVNRSIKIRLLGERSQMLVPYYPVDRVTIENGIAPTDTGNQKYTFEMAVLKDDWEDVWRTNFEDMEPSVGEQYLKLPSSTATDAKKLLQQIPNLDSYDTVQAAQRIASYVSKTAYYSTDVDKMPENREDFAIWFLESADRGYCVHFATAATVLLRAQGIPARYVEGFTFSADAHQRTEVSQDRAHAWVEYYVENVGWVVLDATPGYNTGDEYSDDTDPSGTDPSKPSITEPSHTTKPTTTEPSHSTKPSTTEPSQSTKPSTTEPSQDITEPSQTEPSATQPSEGTTPSESDPLVTSSQVSESSSSKKGNSSPKEPAPRWLVKLLIGLTVTAGALVTLLGQWFLRRWLKLRKLKKGNPGQQVIARYKETCRICRAMKTEVPEKLTALAEKAGFSQHTITKEEVSVANAIFRTHYQSLQNGPWYKKLYWRFILALY